MKRVEKKRGEKNKKEGKRTNKKKKRGQKKKKGEQEGKKGQGWVQHEEHAGRRGMAPRACTCRTSDILFLLFHHLFIFFPKISYIYCSNSLTVAN